MIIVSITVVSNEYHVNAMALSINIVDDAAERRFEVTVSVDDVGFPLQNAMFAGQTNLNPAAACYVRYRFYDRGTTACTWPLYLSYLCADRCVLMHSILCCLLFLYSDITAGTF